MNWNQALKATLKAGEASIKREKDCKGHKQIKTWTKKNGEAWARCRCGLIAKAEASLWDGTDD